MQVIYIIPHHFPLIAASRHLRIARSNPLSDAGLHAFGSIAMYCGLTVAHQRLRRVREVGLVTFQLVVGSRDSHYKATFFRPGPCAKLTQPQLVARAQHRHRSASD